MVLTTPAGIARTHPQRLEVVVPTGRLSRAESGAKRVAAEQILARGARAELLHFFDLTGPALAPSRPYTTTIHDAALRHHAKGLRVMHKRVLQPWSVRNARAAVAVSQFAKDEAVRHFGADPTRTYVVHSGPGLLSSPSERATPVDVGPYLLYVGDLTEHKNLPFLVEAFAMAEVDARLVLAGQRRRGWERVARAVATSPARDRIEIHRSPRDDEIDALYRGATALVLPSLYEGFGFTPLEAMARGCPVLASDIPAVREISGAGALLLPARDGEAWVGAIRRVVADETLRLDLRRRGSEVIRRYSWDDAARAIARLFRAAAYPVNRR